MVEHMPKLMDRDVKTGKFRKGRPVGTELPKVPQPKMPDDLFRASLMKGKR